MPKVSVIIPVHNVGAHLEKCVRSAMGQTLRDIELICVDDASTDDSPQILKMLAAQDARIRVLTLPENLTANQARKNGVLASTGETVMFLDGDDILQPHACETAYEAMQKHKVDVLHYGVKVVNRANVPESRIEWNQNKMKPCLERIEGDLLLACFQKKKFFFTLWNKMFRGDLARQAFARIEDGRFPKAQDLYAVFILLYFARNYKGIPDVLIHYQFGTGITGGRIYELPAFERFCQAALVNDAILRFVQKEGAWGKYETIVSEIRKNVLHDTLNQWIDHLHPLDTAAAFDLLVKYWQVEEVVSTLAEKSVTERERFGIKKLAQYVRGAQSIAVRTRKPKTVGVFYHRYHSGGVQRVISLLMPLFLEWGLKVVLITEEYEPKGEYPLPRGVERVLIPPFAGVKPVSYRGRAEALAEALRKYEIDLLNYHATSSDAALFDLLLAKALSCSVVLSRHELSFASMLNGTDAPARQPAVFALADALTVLTRMDEQYYKLMGVSAVYVPNPLPHLDIQPLEVHAAPPNVLWVGRMDYVQKQCLEPIEIMAEVVRAVPEAKLQMLGGGWSPGAEQKMRERIDALGLRKNVELLGYTPHPEKHYRKAACQLMTSSWESYGMVIAEGRAFGLPLVLYGMPYLDLLRSGQGYIAVEQSDRRAAADAIIRLLQSPELRAKLGREAQQELESANNELLEQQWKRILGLAPHTDAADLELDASVLRMLMENILHLYGKGVARKQEELSKAKKQLAQTSSATSMQITVTEVEASPLPQVTHSGPTRLRTLKELEERRAQIGNLGALDFLIKHEKARHASGV